MTIYTVFFDNGNDNASEMPQDFPTYSAAKEYAEERIAMGYAETYTILES